VADLGFLGVSRNVGGRRVPHFQLVLGGEWTNNAGSYGLAIGTIPSKRVPQVVDALTGAFAAGRQGQEKFREWIERVGKREIKKLIDPLTEVPPYAVDPSFYSDWGDPREYTIGDIGVGECAGEVVSFVEMGLSAAERQLFEAQLALDEKQPAQAYQLAFSAMLVSARALAREFNPNVADEREEIVSEFKKHLFDTQLFFDKFVGPKFAHFFLRAHEAGAGDGSADAARTMIEEGTLFVEASHATYQKITLARQAPAAE
jgi:sulfite reductase (ferredoxin)